MGEDRSRIGISQDSDVGGCVGRMTGDDLFYLISRLGNLTMDEAEFNRFSDIAADISSDTMDKMCDVTDGGIEQLMVLAMVTTNFMATVYSHIEWMSGLMEIAEMTSVEPSPADVASAFNDDVDGYEPLPGNDR